jgi:hypothetical protein
MLFGEEGNRLESCGKIGRALGISRERLRKAVQSGELTAYSFTEHRQKVIRVRKVDLEAWIESKLYVTGEIKNG